MSKNFHIQKTSLLIAFQRFMETESEDSFLGMSFDVWKAFVSLAYASFSKQQLDKHNNQDVTLERQVYTLNAKMLIPYSNVAEEFREFLTNMIIKKATVYAESSKDRADELVEMGVLVIAE